MGSSRMQKQMDRGNRPGAAWPPDDGRFGALFACSPIGMVRCDMEGRCLEANDALLAMLGYSAEELATLDIADLTPRVYADEDSRHLDALRASGRFGPYEKELRRRDGRRVPVRMHGTRVVGEDGRSYCWVTVEDISERKSADTDSLLATSVFHSGRLLEAFAEISEIYRKAEHIRYQAYHDTLTGLPNRALMEDRLGHALEVARRENSSVALMFVDLDRFKAVNDRFGHEMGDLLLIEVAERLQGCLRRSDTIARLGGDEFVVILSDFSAPGEVAEVAEKIVTCLGLPMALGGHKVEIGASIGIAVFPQDGENLVTLMRGADTAMYRAKNVGRSTFRFFDSRIDGQVNEHLRLEAELWRALERSEFELFYQPQIDLWTGAVVGAEALLRWHSPERGLVAPELILPLAEKTGQIHGIGDWVVDQACRQVALWRDSGKAHFRLAVNVSCRQFLAEAFIDRIAASVERYGLEPSFLEIEVTENTVMSDPAMAMSRLARLRQMGVTVAIDDFGRGHTNLAHLKHLPLDRLKIDRSFIQNVDGQPDKAAVVAAIVGVAEALGFSIVAEGVETEGEERHLQALGCQVGQGFRYGAAMAAPIFEGWLRDSAKVVLIRPEVALAGIRPASAAE